jgi:hypothetical protein
MFPVAAKRVANVPVIAFKIFAAKFPVTEILEAVVEPIVDEPIVKIFPNAPIPVTVVEPADSDVAKPFCAMKFVSVVDAKVVDPAVKLVTYKTVEVLFVIVPFVALIADRFTFPADRFVTVAFVMVPFVETRLEIFPFEIFEVEALVVVEYKFVK